MKKNKPKERKKDYYNVNFITNDWEKFYENMVKNHTENVYIQELGVWKNRSLIEELNKKIKRIKKLTKLK